MGAEYGLPPSVDLGGQKALLITFANFDWLDFLQNWVEHVRSIGLGRNFIVAPMDAETHTACTKAGIPVLELDMQSFIRRHGGEIFNGVPATTSTEFLGQLKRDFPNMHRGIMANSAYYKVIETKFHVWALAMMLVSHLNIDILVSDSDVVWFRDPLQYMHRFHGEADISISTDCVSAEVEHIAERVRQSELKAATSITHLRHALFNNDSEASKYMGVPRCGHLPTRRGGTAFNAGLLYVRATNASVDFLRGLVHGMLGGPGREDPYWDDQYVVNEYLTDGMFPVRSSPHEDTSENIVLAHVGRAPNASPPLRVHTLPVELFHNGHTFFVDQIKERSRRSPYAVHATWQMSGNSGKRGRFRRANAWMLDGDAYYDPNGRYLTYAARYPTGFINIADPLSTHMRVVQHHIHGLRNALAIAEVLGRALIVPELDCFCDRDEHPDVMKTDPPVFRQCTVVGSDVTLPFKCPLDHLFDLSMWDHLLGELSYRHASFLDHPRMIGKLREETVYVRDTEHVGGGSAPLTIPVNATERDIRTSLAPTKDVPLLRVELLSCMGTDCDAMVPKKDQSAMNLAFSTFDHAPTNMAFDERTRNLLKGSWCCTSFDKSVGTWHFQLPEPLG